MTTADLAEAKIFDKYVSEDTGVTHIYLRQTAGGLEVANADLGIHVSADGKVISVGGGFVPGLSSKLSSGAEALAPALSVEEAVEAAAATLGLTPSAEVTSSLMGEDGSYLVAAPGVSLDDITARLHYVPTDNGSAALAWQLIVRTPDNEHWYDLSIDASEGTLVSQSDWGQRCFVHGSSHPDGEPQLWPVPSSS